MCEFSCRLEFLGVGIEGGCESLDANSCCLLEYRDTRLDTESLFQSQRCSPG